jgi:putative nucleotidyltransferase with HDIG domain
MTLRIKILVSVVVAGAIASLGATPGYPAREWLHFCVYLAAVLLSSGMKVALPKSEGTMSVNFPFILLGILQLSPLQAVALGVASVVAQCRFKVVKPFTLMQILFNVANVITATVLACLAYSGSLKLMNAQVAPALACGAAVYFVATTVPVALILAWESGSSLAKIWRQEFLWYLPFYLVGAMIAAAANWIGNQFGWLTSLLLIPMVYTVYRAYCEQMAIIRDRERHIVETEALHLRTIEALAMAVEAKDENTHRHLVRVRVYVSELGKAMGLDKLQMQALLTAAYLHDIGKLAVPEYIINKPGKLTPQEFEKMKIHTVVGADILERIHFPYPVVPIVRSHHEAWDGSGYPDGLKGEEIPIGARLLTAVDCFDALASDRPYRKAMPLDEAMAFVKSRAGIQFDATIVAMLEEHFPRLEKLACQQIEKMEPLKTDLFIERGAAPGAGFEPENASADGKNAGAGARTGNAASQPETPIAGAARRAVSSGDAWRSAEQASRLIGSALSARESEFALCDHVRSLFPFDCLALYLRRGDFVVPQFMAGQGAEAFSMRPIPVGEGLSGWVARSGRAILNGNPTVEPNHLAQAGLFTASSSALSIPLFDASQSIAAVLTVYSTREAAFSREDLRIFESIQSRVAGSRALEEAFSR